MLELQKVTKSYTAGDFTQVALDGINLSFRQNEFVAIFGQSGSGKTTCLNIIGGLDHYDSGDLIVNGKSTKKFKDLDWDAYRNNSVGFIFQSYNLISHLSIIDNVELGMTLSGVSAAEKHRKARVVLEKVGLKFHIHKKPNQLSGGQMQRVAIARALANDPDIILADEPTGALDSTTSLQIMDLIKEIANEKLVIMVTHNSELSHRYADRIIEFKDGKVVSDTNPLEQTVESSTYKLKMTSMSFFTALKLSGRNIATKKWRTTLTAFASSIGIIGIALILSLSSGFQRQIDNFQNDALSEFPIIISQTSVDINKNTMAQIRGDITSIITANKEYADSDEVFLYDPAEETITHTNVFTQDFLNYVAETDPEICNSIGYTRIVGMNLVRKVNDVVQPVSMAVGVNMGSSDGSMDIRSMMSNFTSISDIGLASYPTPLKDSEPSYLEKNYDVLYGAYPKDDKGLVLVVDNQNRINANVLKKLGFNVDSIKIIKFNEIVGTELKVILNNDYYIKGQNGNYMPNSDYEAMYNSKNNITLKIEGIVRLKKDITISILGNGIAYSDSLIQRIIDDSSRSEIVKAQNSVDYNIITMEPIDPIAKKTVVSYLGGDATPYIIYLYPSTFEYKDAVLSYLDAYNINKEQKDVIIYSDLAERITGMTGGIMDAITIVLIAFAAISLVVSLIMIGIITYISVLERTKEIGVLRALGARKKDITHVFNAETFIIGTVSGLLGIGIAYLLTFPINWFILDTTSLADVAQLQPLHAIFLLLISVILTLLGGLIPARMAAEKDPVEALRTE
ncbi:MAG: sulfate ABC transporter ATP-binding protein [Firmicutes bacterium HGW-Firmicutes-20]|jgi:putative ABC transport system permease protein|nr:MAG: sulfate ABC transporter ATP-binding protein [Firmicutes bacterium HGW-Firmicutes-20]PKM66424.1 MAG: sulfate ABC transporter ATP-binding protein [Firmicutes bacterium HGW-Firmicutes-19]